jgi:hypothetical protein
MGIRLPIDRVIAGRAPGRHKETRRTADVGHRDSVPIDRAEQARELVPRMQTGHPGQVLGTAGLLRVEIRDQTRPPTTATDRPLHLQIVGAATRMAGIRMGIARISRPHVLVRRREVITRMLLRTTAAGVVATDLMTHRRVLTRRPLLALIPQRLVVAILPRRGHIPHRPRRHGPTPLLAAVMAAEVAAVEVPRMEAVAGVPRMGAVATPAAAVDRTDTK